MRIPKPVKDVLETLEKNNFQSFIVGGCVRDIFTNKKPKDWDVTTNATPDQIIKLFKKTYSLNRFGTVTILTGSKIPSLKEVEVTTFRTEQNYSDNRHPDKVEWAETIEEDLSRRDFTSNAIAVNSQQEIIDPFDGKKDIDRKLLKAVGDADERFKEDALRLMRAVRFASTIGFEIEGKTKKAIIKNAKLLKNISKERIRDEFLKIIMSDIPSKGIEMLRELGLLEYVLPELLEGYKVGQNKHHVFDVYEHSVKALDYAAQQKFNIYVRVAALLHDIGKPRSKDGEGEDSTFYNHEIIGAKMTRKILNDLKFAKKDAEKIIKLVRYHLFYYNVDEVHESSVRRLLSNVGQENFDELVEVRMSDRIGSGCPKALPYKLRHFQYVADKVSQDVISVNKLKIGGQDVMGILKVQPGPILGKVLNILLGEVLDDPRKNTKKYLKPRVKELGGLEEKELDKLFNEAKEKKDQIVSKRDEMTKKKYWVT
jgi:tRNA nucleotidyltransferase (CCA-adding enzyme)